ncbi:restriction endonuclease subunit S [Paracoccus sp. Z118]|uniref:restriction endonuclease subunit S n=1 Tax=Paracoccus sp. Z118 TaxID=2851017 RepID=UPI001C2BF1D0|nr:restriction endonuclease subunit S [Paracoccus sp. Z118]MBV0893545.1 restriction endonuclease subunit S [Paracoccus sp. Z118]
MEATATDAEIAKFSLRVGDVIFTKDSETADDIGIAAIVSEELPGVVCGYHLSIARPNDGVDGRFIKAFFDSAAAKGYFAVSANGLTRVGLGQSAINNLQLAVPPLPEQQAIAAFLERETAKIDGLIEEQRRLIALLAEKRQANISYAVTRGLNPSARLKPSGVDWLGVIPEGWEVVPLKRLAAIGNGSTPNRDNLSYWQDGHYPWLNSSVVNMPEVTFADQFVTDIALRECHLPIVKAPAVLIGITGQGKTRGLASILSLEATINQHLAYVRPNDVRITCEFITWIFRAAYEYVRADSEAGSTKGAITCDYLANLKIPLPPKDEIAAICNHLKSISAEIDGLTEAATSAITLLQERRAALISAAVTGKIDVRDLASVQEAA